MTWSPEGSANGSVVRGGFVPLLTWLLEVVATAVAGGGVTAQPAIVSTAHELTTQTNIRVAHAASHSMTGVCAPAGKPSIADSLASATRRSLNAGRVLKRAGPRAQRRDRRSVARHTV